MSHSIDLDVLKDDLGITDDYDDAWLERRVQAIWDRIEKYTQRVLTSPPESFRDEWGRVQYPWLAWPDPGPARWEPRRTFLRVFPVVSIDAVTLSGDEFDTDELAAVVFDKATGEILSFDGTTASASGYPILQAPALITYTAGWETLPSDLYEIVLAVMVPQWSGRQASAALSGATSISINDVGSIDLATSTTSFADAAVKSGGDPLLGPYTNTLDPYVDYRTMLGGSPATVRIGES